ncbi:uncharacterized protein LY89DRAFT_212758 [Mollisia scopiformis]|uniref:Orp1 like protein n=1 Tax=Mollisia scopiformis TaxID=149040 RepID=A0A194WVU6_MOLSC|nr:uncharacterized protein LY89DRAFT_212758 [Mollisia scopiformis]KUJ11799.1 hypothetical protein LY89DRAFT_212758 [Mollisia scopiformis]
MDVTSLLNANSAAAEQQRKMEKGEATKTPTRNRTPWDAGGYSLPINTLSNPTLSTPTPYNIHHDDSQQISASTPTSPRHKFSDSRSSLSSFTSSLQSTTHSRFSSMSTTVSGSQPLNSLAETLSPTANLKIQEMDLTPPLSESHIPRPHGSLSPTGSLDALALVAETRITDQEATSSTLRDKTSTTPEQTPNQTIITNGRPSSPSDAILIKRATLPSLRVVTGDHELNGAGQAHHLHNHNFLSAPLETHHQSLMHPRSHKRALSAPDFSMSNSSLPPTGESMGMRPLAEPTPPSSHHPDNPSPTATTAAYPNPDTPPMTNADTESHAVVCMYIPNCDTGSQPRKAISHIFGRNKMCTRLIPQHVWVHYCRKHYQRSRYRNPKEYAKLQCDLVQQQIRRVHEWSLANSKSGVAGIVQDWGLAVRKREQKRLDDLGGSRKRNAATFENDSDDGEDAAGRAVAVPATAVPDWLLTLCGKGYNTQTILEIFNRLHTEILEDTLPCFPDIEILPNIVVDQDEPKSPKGYTKRTPQGHKRAQSLGVGMKPAYGAQGQDRRLSQPAILGHDGLYLSPAQKRRRPNDMAESSSPVRNPSSFQASRFAERSSDSSRHISQLGHRSAFANIDENQAGESDYYGFESSRQNHAPLPAPVAQRFGGQSVAAHLETSNEYSPARRPIHQRSQSDMGGFARGRFEYSPAPGMMYSPPRNSQYRDSPQIGGPVYGSQPRYEPIHAQYADPRQHGHHRAQSSSVIYGSYPAMPSLREHQSLPMPPYTQNQAGPPASNITESKEARTLYSSRR